MTKIGKFDGGWAPDVTLRANLVKCPFDWKLNVN